MNSLPPFSPVWLANRQKAAKIHARMLQEDLTISQFVDECLAAGIAPEINYLNNDNSDGPCITVQPTTRH